MRKLLVACTLALAACGDSNKPIDRVDETRGERVTSVKSTSSVTATRSSVPPASSTVGTAPNPKHAPICGEAVDLEVPKVKLDHVEVKGAKALSTDLETGGTWTWINVWAAYCGPCREEIPRIKEFGEKLAKDGAPIRIHFVSFDDDARESLKFMEKGALSQSLFLDENDHEKLLSGLGLPKTAALPVQIFVDPKGKIRCVGKGAIEDEDYNEIFHLVKAR